MTTNFNEFALHPALQTSLTNMKFEIPTPIQAMAIPLGLEGRDILGSAQTGTGKTGAFCVPMINFLLENPTAHALVMLPTRELATQVHDVARKMIGYDAKGPNGIKTALLIGGEPIGKQYAQLQRRPRLIVGTPGRINDHLRSNQDLVDRVEFAVLDEADRMLDMGFLPQIDSILSETAIKRQTMMFSATFPDSIVKFSRQYLNNPERISAGVQSKPGENIIQETTFVAQEQKYDELMLQLGKREGSVIVFVRTQHGADKLSVKLNRDEQTSEAIHGGLRQRQRDKVIRMFRNGEIRILVATDVAARGLDVPHIEHVVNYDLPQVAEDYIHRIGRTARNGEKGHAVSFVANGEKHLWRDIERMLNPNDPGSEIREGGRGGTKKQFGGGKKFGGKPSFGGERKSFGGGDRPERNYGPKKENKFGPRKPFGRADRKEKRESGWNPDGDFRSSEAGTEGAFDARPQRNEGFKKPYNNDRPRREFGDRPQRSENRSEGYQGNRDGGFKKPYQKREDGFASNPDSYKRTNSGDRKEGGFKKPYNRDNADRPRRDFGDRPQRAEGGYQGNREGGYQGNREGGFKKPYNRDGGSDRPQGDRPFRKEGEGFKKPYNRDNAQGDRPRSNNGDRPFVKREGGSAEGGFKKPFRKEGEGFKKPFKKEGGSFRKDGAQRSEGHSARSKKRAY